MSQILIKTDISKTMTRSRTKQNCQILRCRTTFGQFLLSVKSTHLWNSQQLEIKSQTELKRLRVQVKHLLKQSQKGEHSFHMKSPSTKENQKLTDSFAIDICSCVQFTSIVFLLTIHYNCITLLELKYITLYFKSPTRDKDYKIAARLICITCSLSCGNVVCIVPTK